MIGLIFQGEPMDDLMLIPLCPSAAVVAGDGKFHEG